jgi:chemotaxis signal transduction protein
MRYITFKIGNKNLAIPYSTEYVTEPTLINKITNITNRRNKYYAGVINYKGKMVNVYDLSKMYRYPAMKKFDGLIFINFDDELFAIQFEGFYKIENEVDPDIVIDVEEIRHSLTS